MIRSPATVFFAKEREKDVALPELALAFACTNATACGVPLTWLEFPLWPDVFTAATT